MGEEAAGTIQLIGAKVTFVPMKESPPPLGGQSVSPILIAAPRAGLG
jgi:hypothetical protein